MRARRGCLLLRSVLLLRLRLRCLLLLGGDGLWPTGSALATPAPMPRAARAIPPVATALVTTDFMRFLLERIGCGVRTS
ncbi:hypothetical protein Rwratislav_32857 [Rhodococcus wratislaviensis IFP 2016]|nr:hypothetical protein Rwratislav_32857 [Rhodococcus wratislaviensis IFP 2016]